ncbi:MAG: type II toxin-antitoxin system VapC family toxin [Actinomycetota bacterium]
MNREGFRKAISGSATISLDSQVIIYHLEDIIPYSALTDDILSQIITGRRHCNLSALSIIEIMVKPIKTKRDTAVLLFDQFLNSIPRTTILPIDRKVAFRAAKLRAEYNLKTPDAIILATAIISNSSCFITNDFEFKKVDSEGTGTRIVFLDDYLT